MTQVFTIEKLNNERINIFDSDNRIVETDEINYITPSFISIVEDESGDIFKLAIEEHYTIQCKAGEGWKPLAVCTSESIELVFVALGGSLMPQDLRVLRSDGTIYAKRNSEGSYVTGL